METLAKAPIEQKMGRVVRTVVKGAVEIGKAVAMLPFACGYVANPEIKRGTLNVHDHGLNQRKIVESDILELYNVKKHGSLLDFLNEGDRLSAIHPNSTSGKAPIHRHQGRDGTSKEHTSIITNNYSFPNHFSNIFLAIGAATFEPSPPPSTRTVIEICGLTTGAKTVNQA